MVKFANKRISVPKVIVLSMLAILIIVIVDISAALKADRIIRSQHLNFDDILTEAQLSFDGPRLQGCKFDTALGIYLYQTCFLLNKSFEDKNKWVFRFIYQSPQAILFGGNNKNSYYFSEVGVAPTIKKIYFDGTIKDITKL